MKTIEESAIEDNNDIPSKAKTQLEKAINKCNLVIENYLMQSPLKINDKSFITEEILNTYKTIYKTKI